MVFGVLIVVDMRIGSRENWMHACIGFGWRGWRGLGWVGLDCYVISCYNMI